MVRFLGSILRKIYLYIISVWILDATAWRDGLVSIVRRKHRFAIQRIPKRSAASTVYASPKVVLHLDIRAFAIKYVFLYFTSSTPALNPHQIMPNKIYINLHRSL